MEYMVRNHSKIRGGWMIMRVWNSRGSMLSTRCFLENDEYWNLTLTETPVSDSIRKLFTIILNTCQLGSPLQFWMKHCEDMADDLKYASKPRYQFTVQYSVHWIKHRLKWNHWLKLNLAMRGKNLQEFGSGLPKTNHQISDWTPRYIARELTAFVNEHELKLLLEQC